VLEGAPVAVEAVPTGQFTQDDTEIDPTKAEYDPGKQGMQVDALVTPVYVPAAQKLHAPAPVEE